MPLITKENVLKVFAFFLVLVMIIEIPALFMKNSNIPENTEQTTEQPENVTILFGVAITNVTVSSYGSSLGSSIKVSGNSSKLDEIVKGLKSDKLVAYTTQEKNGLTLNLVKGANMSVVIERLSPLNMTMLSQAELTFDGPVVFTTEEGSQTISLQAIRADIDPSIPTGYKLGIKLMARIRNGAIIESQYAIVPIKLEIVTLAETVKLFPQYTAIAVLDWPDRAIDKNTTTAYLSERFSNVTVSTIINDTVSFSKPLSSTALFNITAMNLSYVKAIIPSRMLVSQDLTDAQLLEKDLHPILAPENITLIYPYSFARVDFTTENYSSDFLNSSFKNLGLFVYRKSTLRVGEKLYDDDGKPYKVIGRETTDLFTYKNETGGAEIVAIAAESIGNKILNYTVAE